MANPFARHPDMIRAELVMATSRRALARTNRDRVLEDARRADDEALRYEMQLELCARQIDGLLDELGHRQATDTGEQAHTASA